VRLACGAVLPPPEELARLLREGGPLARAPDLPQPPPARPGVRPQLAQTLAAGPPLPAAAPPLQPSPPARAPTGFAELVELIRASGEHPLAAHLEQGAHLIRFEPGRIELRAGAALPKDAASRLGETASRLTGRRWLVVLANAPGEPTLAEQHAALRLRRLDELRQDAAFRRVLDAYPGAQIVDVRRRPASADPALSQSDPPTDEAERA